MTAVAERAEVTRPDFYQLFSGKEACLLAAFAKAASVLADEVGATLEPAAPAEAHTAVLGALARAARERPSEFKLVTQEALVAGPRALAARLALLEALCAPLESRWAQAGPRDRIPDLPALLVIGGVIRYFAMAGRHGSLDFAHDVGELEAWIESYGVPSRRRRSHELAPIRGLEPPATLAGSRIPPARHLPRRGDVPAVAYASIEREHIVHAAAAIVSEHGYDKADVGEIAAAAGMAREVFYRHFDNKGAVVDAVATAVFEQCMAAMGGAYFAASTPWADRIWRSSWALTTVLSSAPSFSHVAFVDSFAPDLASARRADELFLGFTIFLTEGSETTGSGQVASIVPRAITGATIELGVASAARGTLTDLPGLVPLGTLLTIAPYVGIDRAKEFVETRSSPRRSASREKG